VIIVITKYLNFYKVGFYILEWRWNAADNASDDVLIHRRIVSYFGDTMNPQIPFSIQKLIAIGRESGRKAGDWYGPASIANALWYGACCTLLIILVTKCL